MEWASLVIAVAPLFVSGFTAWLTQFRRGKLAMMPPNV